jgi:hypothetical protein
MTMLAAKTLMSLTVDRVRRLGALAGVVFVVLAVIAVFLPGMPSLTTALDGGCRINLRSVRAD